MPRGPITVGWLKKWLADKPDDMCVVSPDEDHSYRAAKVQLADAVWFPGNEWCEHPGGDAEELADYDFPEGFRDVKVVVVE